MHLDSNLLCCLEQLSVSIFLGCSCSYLVNRVGLLKYQFQDNRATMFVVPNGGMFLSHNLSLCLLMSVGGRPLTVFDCKGFATKY